MKEITGIVHYADRLSKRESKKIACLRMNYWFEVSVHALIPYGKNDAGGESRIVSHRARRSLLTLSTTPRSLSLPASAIGPILAALTY